MVRRIYKRLNLPLLVVIVIVSSLPLILSCSVTREPKPTNPPTPTPVPTPLPTSTPSPTPTPSIQQLIEEAVRKALGTSIPPTPVSPTPIPSPILPTPIPTPTLVPITIMPTPIPIPIIPTPIPLPTATPITKYPSVDPSRAFELPIEKGGLPLLDYIEAPTFVLGTFNLKATIKPTASAPTAILLFAAQDKLPPIDPCSTEKPVLFLRQGPPLGYMYPYNESQYTWQYCRGGYSLPPTTDIVPWHNVQTWDYQAAERVLKVHTTIKSEELSLDYGDSVGWITVIYSGSRIIARTWIDK